MSKGWPMVASQRSSWHGRRPAQGHFYDIFMTVRDAPTIFLPAAGVVATGGVSGRDKPLLRRYGQEGNVTQIMRVSDWLLHNMLNINGVYVRHLGQSLTCLALPYRERPSNA